MVFLWVNRTFLFLKKKGEMDLGGFAPPASRVLAGNPLSNVAGGSARGGAQVATL